MEFLNRREEMKRLDALARLPEAAAVVIWGRRRLGKTRLLLEWSQKHKGIYYTADESAPAVQRKYFALALDQVFSGFSSVDYPDWTAFFRRLAKEAQQIHWRGPLVIDELPYLISMSPELPSILQKFIDSEAKQAKLIIALCGSSQRMMQGAVLNPSAPLYGRASEVLKLSPISVGYIGEALNLTQPREIIESYAIWGGTPRYWELVRNGSQGFFESIERIVLDPMGPLNDEPNRLLLEELPPAPNLRPILDAIGLGAHRLSEISSRISQPVTSLTRLIHRLIELDLIEREVPYGMAENNTKRSLYKFKDPFLHFWFEIVGPRRSYFAQISSATRIRWLKKNVSHLFSITWEDLCRAAIPKLAQLWGEDLVGPAGRYWYGQGHEWDILANGLEGKRAFIGEAKWTERAPTTKWVMQTINELKAKGVPPIAQFHGKTIEHLLFLPEKPKGFQCSGVRLIDAEEVITAFRNH